MLVQRFSALRSGGFLAQKFNRIPNVEYCTSVSKKHFSRHIAKPLLVAGLL
jgi:hypothetical protein